MAELYANNAQSTLVAAIVNSTRPVTFSVVSAAAFPATGQFRVMIDAEILVVTARSGTSFTATSDEASVISPHALGATVTHILTDKGLRQGIDDRVAAHTALPDTHHAKTHGHASAGDGGVLAGYTGILLAEMTVPGTLALTTTPANLPRLYLPPSPGAGSANWSLYALRANVVTPSAGAAIWPDVLMNDVSIWTAGGQHDTDIMKLTSGNRANNWKTSPGMPVACTASDYFSIAIAQIGTTTPGADLTVEFAFVKVV